MALITPYVANNLSQGSNLNLRVKKIIWLTVGHGRILSLSDYEVAVKGEISLFGYKGELNVLIRLLDRKPQAKSGPCTMQLNVLRDDNASYVAQNGVLTVNAMLGGEKQNIHLSRYENGRSTKCHLVGYVTETAYLT